MRRLGAALALAAASLLIWGAPARADEPGFEVRFGDAPGTYTIGKAAKSLTAQVATDRGRRCQKVRWAMTIRAEGVSLDQIKITRIENNTEFRVRGELRGDTAQLIDADLDPGELCRDRTVTGQWNIGFDGPDAGSVTFAVSALDLRGRVLSSARTTSRVLSPVASSKSPSPSPTPTPSSTFTPEPEPEEAAIVDPADDPTDGPARAADLTATSSHPSLLGPGLIVGAVLVFLGVGILLRMRSRSRRLAAEEATLPTGFYSMPRRRN